MYGALTWGELWAELVKLMPEETWNVEVSVWHHRATIWAVPPSVPTPRWRLWLDTEATFIDAGSAGELLAKVRATVTARPPRPPRPPPAEMALLGEVAHDRSLTEQEYEADAKGDAADEERGHAREDAS